MQYEEIWNKIFNAQNEILEKLKQDEDSYISQAAEDIIKYRKDLQDKNCNVDIIAYTSISKAHEEGDIAYGYGLEYRGDPYFDVEEKIDIISNYFKDISDEDYVHMTFEMCKEIKSLGL